MRTRITSNMLSTDYLRNVNRNLTNMKSLQNQLSSGNKIQKASENPYIASRTMQLNSEISYNKQYDENIKDTSNWLDTTDTALSQMGNVFSRVQTLLVNAGNGTYGPDEKSAIQDEIKEKINELSQVLNTNFDGSYIFGGTKTDSKPTTVINGKLMYADKDGNGITRDSTTGVMNIDLTTSPIKSTSNPVLRIDNMQKGVPTATDVKITIDDYTNPASPLSSTASIDLTQLGIGTPPKTMDDLFVNALTSKGFTAADAQKAAASYSSLDQIGSSLNVDISDGVKTVYNKTASEVLEFTDSTGKKINVSDLLSNIVNDLGTTGNVTNLITTDLTDIQSVTTNLLQKRSEVGTMQNRMDSAQQNNEAQNYDMTDILSKTNDVDFAEATMDYSMMQTVYTASLQTSAKILPMTILNYI